MIYQSKPEDYALNAIVLLSAVMAGQVKGSNPTNASPVAQTPAARTATVAAPRYAIRTYRIRHEGLTFSVRGYYRPDLQRVVWNQDDPFNQQTHSIALVTQATFGFEQDGTSPGLVPSPLVASLPVSSGVSDVRRPASVIGMPSPLTRERK